MPAQHWIITYASCLSEGRAGSAQAVAELQLPHVKQVLSHLNQRRTDLGSEHSLSLPHERLLGSAWPDGLVPLAAQRAREISLEIAPGVAHAPVAGPGPAGWAFITPCHWATQANSIMLSDPAQLQVSEAESRSLLESMRPYFQEDGIQLCFDAPGRWLAQSELFNRLPTAHPDRAVGRNLLQWLPSQGAGEAGRTLRRLQNEMQMLLYQHPVNDARAARGLPAVNSFWVSGTGALDAANVSLSAQPMPQVIDTLRDPALRQDWAAWARGWQQLDAGLFADLAKQTTRREPITLSLCGERGSVTCVAGPKAWWSGLSGLSYKKKAYFPNIDVNN